MNNLCQNSKLESFSKKVMTRGDTRVFLGNLPLDCKVKDIEEFLESCGRVRNVLIKQRKYGFAEFEHERDAEDAVHDLNGRTLHGNRIVVELAKVNLSII